jgi:hypothetical protein
MGLRNLGAGDFKMGVVSCLLTFIGFLLAIGVIIGIGFFISGPGLISFFCGVLHSFFPSGGKIEILGTGVFKLVQFCNNLFRSVW